MHLLVSGGQTEGAWPRDVAGWVGAAVSRVAAPAAMTYNLTGEHMY